MNNEQAAEILQDIFQHAVNSARAGPVTLANLPEKPRGRCVVIGAGKASAAMAAPPFRQRTEEGWRASAGRVLAEGCKSDCMGGRRVT
ncbi:DUF4147 domain-containing protein, partial [Pseudomonas aeruginosa]|nr:DUF4147 domain-containing protein [Pseudomonas aeruginosa]